MAESDWKYLQYNVENGQKRTSDGPSGGASSLADLDDTSISNPSNGQMLGYDETAGKWKNVQAPAGSVSDVKLDNQSVVDQNGVAQLTTPNIDALGKTAISNPADGEMLGYDGTEGKWKNVSAPGGNVDDVEVNGVSVVNAQKVAEIKSYKEVTQAQYEALPDTKLNDGVLYAIKDGGQAIEGFPPLIYSDEEREIGVWRDGKPLYQKVITTNNTTTGSWVAIDISALSIDTPCFWYGAFNRNTGGIEYWYLFDSREGGHDDVYSGTFRIDGENGTPNGRILYKIKTFEGNNKQIFILQYTKTTDTPGSGTWNSQGALAHHYSTDEKVIGTWINGKPLYERTFAYNISPVNDWTLFDDSVSYDLLIGASGYHKNLLSEVFSLVSSDDTNPRWCIQPDHKLYYFITNNITRSGHITIQYTKTTD